MNTIPRIEFYLERIYELLSNAKPTLKRKSLTKQEVMQKYHLTYLKCSELFSCRNSPAYRVGNLWRVDEDDFDLWYLKYINDIKNELDLYLRKENTKRMIVTEANTYCKLLYGMSLDEYLSKQDGE